MDNGLIFPYRQNSAHDEPGDAKCPKPHGSFGTIEAERTIRTGISQAMG